MDNREKIVDKILSDARAKADELIKEGGLEADAIAAGAEVQKKNAENEVRQKVAEAAKEYLRRRLAIAELDVKKDTLKAKQEVVDEVFLKAFDRLYGGGREYLAFIKKLLQSNAEKGETVMICREDKERITEQFLAESCKGLDLKLSQSTADFKGGVILSGKNYDKNLTLETVLKQTRQTLEPEIAKILFG